MRRIFVAFAGFAIITSIAVVEPVEAQVQSQRQSAARQADSLLVERSLQMYAARTITRRQFDQEVGAARADSIIRDYSLRGRADSILRALQDTARDTAHRTLNANRSATLPIREYQIAVQDSTFTRKVQELNRALVIVRTYVDSIALRRDSTIARRVRDIRQSMDTLEAMLRNVGAEPTLTYSFGNSNAWGYSGQYRTGWVADTALTLNYRFNSNLMGTGWQARFGTNDTGQASPLRMNYGGRLDTSSFRLRSSMDTVGMLNLRGDIRTVAPAIPPRVSLGMGLQCEACSVEPLSDGRILWTFSRPPVVAAVEANSIAERVGLRRGDTLRTVDGIALTTRAGGTRLGDIEPGRAVRLTWSRGGTTHSGTLVPGSGTVTSAGSAAAITSVKVGNTEVEVRGDDISYTRDARTGELRITSGSATIVIRPPGAARADTAVRRQQ